MELMREFPYVTRRTPGGLFWMRCYGVSGVVVIVICTVSTGTQNGTWEFPYMQDLAIELELEQAGWIEYCPGEDTFWVWESYEISRPAVEELIGQRV